MSFVITILSIIIYFGGTLGLLLWLFFYARRKEQRDKDFIQFVKDKIENGKQE